MVLWLRLHASNAGGVGKIPDQGTQILLMRVKEESEKASLKLSIRKVKIMASSSIISWQIDGGNVEIVTNFIFLCSKITVDHDYIYEIKRYLLEEKLWPT